ncbi:hypothetical protein IJG26_02640 [Candidatus Saccharibacteria bacterium]|nr:hypothetical protein [Candidatus Saccharibacteria bacterium]
MAKEVAIGKRAKISEAQQNMILAVLIASVFLGAAISLILHFVEQIKFNARVIIGQDEAIVSYSNVIKNIGICEKPNGDVYSYEELEKCNPDNISISKIPGTLRANILQDVAASEALYSVANDDDQSCVNPETNKKYTYDELNKIYNNAGSATERQAASQLMKSCSALRVIPDALPSYANEEALLTSLNKLFDLSGWKPQSISPSNSKSTDAASGAKTISVNLSVEADTATTMSVLNNIEHSIREFNIERATIEWGSDDTLSLRAQANAFYMEPSTIKEETKTIKPEGKK